MPSQLTTWSKQIPFLSPSSGIDVLGKHWCFYIVEALPSKKTSGIWYVYIYRYIFIYELQYLPRMSLPTDGHRHGLWNDVLVFWISAETFCGFNCHKNSNIQQTECILLFLKQYDARLKVYFC